LAGSAQLTVRKAVGLAGCPRHTPNETARSVSAGNEPTTCSGGVPALVVAGDAGASGRYFHAPLANDAKRIYRHSVSSELVFAGLALATGFRRRARWMSAVLAGVWLMAAAWDLFPQWLPVWTGLPLIIALVVASGYGIGSPCASADQRRLQTTGGNPRRDGDRCKVIRAAVAYAVSYAVRTAARPAARPLSVTDASSAVTDRIRKWRGRDGNDPSVDIAKDADQRF
jgi:hypothetical protein